jgi:hypothetical protein
MNLSEFIVIVTVAFLGAPMIAFIAYVLAMSAMAVCSVMVWLAGKLWWRID